MLLYATRNALMQLTYLVPALVSNASNTINSSDTLTNMANVKRGSALLAPSTSPADTQSRKLLGKNAMAELAAVTAWRRRFMVESKFLANSPNSRAMAKPFRPSTMRARRLESRWVATTAVNRVWRMYECVGNVIPSVDTAPTPSSCAACGGTSTSKTPCVAFGEIEFMSSVTSAAPELMSKFCENFVSIAARSSLVMIGFAAASDGGTKINWLRRNPRAPAGRPLPAAGAATPVNILTPLVY